MGTTPVETIKIKLETRMREQLLSVDFAIGNELVAVLGRDGAGKTEILRSIAGVYTPENGAIEIAGREVFNAALAINVPPVERFAGWVPAVTSLFPHQSIADNVAFPLRRGHMLTGNEAARRVDEVLDLLELSAIRNAILGESDARIQHNVANARALVIDPEILLLDQPYRNLEISMQRKVRHDLQHLRRRIGVPTLFATTDLEEAYEIADRIALVDRGRLLQIDQPRTLVTQPRNRAVAELVRSVNVFPGTVLEAFDDGAAAIETPIGTLQVIGSADRFGDVEVVIRPEHIRVLSEGEPPPEDDNVLSGHILEDNRYGPLHALTFHPEGAGPGDVLEISVSDLLYRQLGLGEQSRQRIVLPAQALHVMDLMSATAAEAQW